MLLLSPLFVTISILLFPAKTCASPTTNTTNTNPLKQTSSDLPKQGPIKLIAKRQIDQDSERIASSKLLPSKAALALATASRLDDPWFLDESNTHSFSSPDGSSSSASFMAPGELNGAKPYRFSYNVRGPNGQTQQYRQEAGDGKYLTGSYGYMLPDGIYRHVDYIADDRGFKAYIRTSEPGTESKNPADVIMDARPLQVYSPSIWNDFNSYNNGNISQQYGHGLLYPKIPSSISNDHAARLPPGAIVNNEAGQSAWWLSSPHSSKVGWPWGWRSRFSPSINNSDISGSSTPNPFESAVSESPINSSGKTHTQSTPVTGRLWWPQNIPTTHKSISPSTTENPLNAANFKNMSSLSSIPMRPNDDDTWLRSSLIGSTSTTLPPPPAWLSHLTNNQQNSQYLNSTWPRLSMSLDNEERLNWLLRSRLNEQLAARKSVIDSLTEGSSSFDGKLVYDEPLVSRFEKSIPLPKLSYEPTNFDTNFRNIADKNQLLSKLQSARWQANFPTQLQSAKFYTTTLLPTSTIAPAPRFAPTSDFGLKNHQNRQKLSSWFGGGHDNLTEYTNRQLDDEIESSAKLFSSKSSLHTQHNQLSNPPPYSPQIHGIKTGQTKFLNTNDGEIKHFEDQQSMFNRQREFPKLRDKQESGGIKSRSIQMPSDANLKQHFMSDWRSMQSSLGLPQPPRVGKQSRTHGDTAFKLVQSLNVSKEPVLAPIELFDARRIIANSSTNNSTRMTLSELDKFKLRLKSQLMAVQALNKKSNSENSIFPTNTQSRSPTNLSSTTKHMTSKSDKQATANSSVRYDEEPDTPRSVQLPQTTQSNIKALESARIGRQNIESMMNVTNRHEYMQVGNETSVKSTMIPSTNNRPNSVEMRKFKTGILQEGGNQNDLSSTKQSKSIDSPTNKLVKSAVNSINMDFINSVTALSVDPLNPFALNSANPAITASKQQYLSPLTLSGIQFGDNTELRSLAKEHLAPADKSNHLLNHKSAPITSKAPYTNELLSINSKGSIEAQSSNHKPSRNIGSHKLSLSSSLVDADSLPPSSIEYDRYKIDDSSMNSLDAEDRFNEVVSANSRRSPFIAFKDPQLSVSATAAAA